MSSSSVSSSLRGLSKRLRAIGLCNGIRHLFWDAGLGFDLRTAYASGILVVLASLGLTGLSWGLGLVFYFTR